MITATQKQNDFAQWAQENILAKLNGHLTKNDAQEIAMSVRRFQQSSGQKITEKDLRNLVPHRATQHAQLSEIVKALKDLSDKLDSKHCETIQAWVRKNILPILFKDGFKTSDAKEIYDKLKRKEVEKKWFVRPQDFNLMFTEPDIIEAQKKVVINKGEVGRRIEIVDTFFEDEK